MVLIQLIIYYSLFFVAPVIDSHESHAEQGSMLALQQAPREIREARNGQRHAGLRIGNVTDESPSAARGISGFMLWTLPRRTARDMALYLPPPGQSACMFSVADSDTSTTMDRSDSSDGSERDAVGQKLDKKCGYRSNNMNGRVLSEAN